MPRSDWRSEGFVTQRQKKGIGTVPESLPAQLQRRSQAGPRVLWQTHGGVDGTADIVLEDFHVRCQAVRRLLVWPPLCRACYWPVSSYRRTEAWSVHDTYASQAADVLMYHVLLMMATNRGLQFGAGTSSARLRQVLCRVPTWPEARSARRDSGFSRPVTSPSPCSSYHSSADDPRHPSQAAKAS